MSAGRPWGAWDAWGYVADLPAKCPACDMALPAGPLQDSKANTMAEASAPEGRTTKQQPQGPTQLADGEFLPRNASRTSDSDGR